MIETFGDMIRTTSATDTSVNYASTDYNDNALFVIREMFLQRQMDNKDCAIPHLTATVNFTTMRPRDVPPDPPFDARSIHHASESAIRTGHRVPAA